MTVAVSFQKSRFGRLPDGSAVDLYTLRSGRGVSVSISTYGAIITSVHAPDRWGNAGEVTLARDRLEEYLDGHPYYGALVGRVCNRISGGGFTLNDRFYPLSANSGDLHLHGGIRGFDKHLYTAEVEPSDHAVTLHLSRTSPDGEEGYPGNLEVRHSLTVHEDNRLVMTFQAETDAATVVNLTNHTYWNLTGEGNILGHEVRIPGRKYAETSGMVPTGTLAPVSGTPCNFLGWKRVGEEIGQMDETEMRGYDYSFTVEGWEPGEPVLRQAAVVRDPGTGRLMEIYTTYPAVHFYSGNNLPGQLGRDGAVLKGREALCFECQFFPDSPNRPEFPSIVLQPGETYLHRTEHRFLTC